jgi:hypothetical protein
VKKQTYIIPLGLAGLLVLATLGLLALRSRMPGSWGKLHAGMTQEEVESSVMVIRGESGWQTAIHEAPMLGSRSYWELWLDYDTVISPRRSARLIHASARFVHPFPLLASRWRKLA